MKEHVKNGIPAAPRFSVSADPEAAASTPIVSFVDKLAKQNRIQNWQRPPVREYHIIEQILGEEIFAALNGECSDEEALTRSQNRIDDGHAGGGILLKSKNGFLQQRRPSPREPQSPLEWPTLHQHHAPVRHDDLSGYVV